VVFLVLAGLRDFYKEPSRKAAVHVQSLCPIHSATKVIVVESDVPKKFANPLLAVDIRSATKYACCCCCCALKLFMKRNKKVE
jgi:hypothetical protein